LLAQQLHQEGAPLDRRRCRLAVHGQAHRLLHGNLPLIARPNPEPTGRRDPSKPKLAAPPRRGQGGMIQPEGEAPAPPAGDIAATNLPKNSSVILRAVASISREPICASLPPTCDCTS